MFDDIFVDNEASRAVVRLLCSYGDRRHELHALLESRGLESFELCVPGYTARLLWNPEEEILTLDELTLQLIDPPHKPKLKIEQINALTAAVEQLLV